MAQRRKGNRVAAVAVCTAEVKLSRRPREHEFATRISLFHRDYFPTFNLERDNNIRKLFDAELVRPRRPAWLPARCRCQAHSSLSAPGPCSCRILAGEPRHSPAAEQRRRWK